MNDLKKFYQEKVVANLKKELGYDNVMQIPKVTHITVNMGVGDAVNDKGILTKAVEDLAKITGQKPVVTKAKKSVAGFKIREGWPIGCKVTLRGNSMYNFLQRLLSIAIPRIRDFRGMNAKSFDGRGNYSFGVKESIIFPEVALGSLDSIRGMDITIGTSAANNKDAKALLQQFNFPFSS